MKRGAQESVVFQHGDGLAVRLVSDCRLPAGTRIVQRREGAHIVLEPVSRWPRAFRNAIGSFKGAIPRPPQGRKPRMPSLKLEDWRS